MMQIAGYLGLILLAVVFAALSLLVWSLLGVAVSTARPPVQLAIHPNHSLFHRSNHLLRLAQLSSLGLSFCGDYARKIIRGLTELLNG